MVVYSRYPQAIDDSSSLPISTDLVTAVNAEVANRLRSAIINVESALGIMPEGVYGTVRDRLDAIDAVTGGGDVTFQLVKAALSGATSSVSFNNQSITHLGSPSAATDAATKAYVDSVISGETSIANIASLRTTPVGASNSVIVLSHTSLGDGGGGIFYWDSASTTADNNGTVIQVTGIVTGRWKRLFTGDIDIRWFGAIPGASNSYVAIQAAIDFASSQGTTEVYIPGNYSISTAITGRSNVFIVGDSNGSSSVAQLTSGLEVYVAIDQSNCGFRRIKITSAGNAHGVVFKTSTTTIEHPTIEECVIQSWGSSGIICSTNISTNVITATSHGFSNDDIIQFSSIVGAFLDAVIFNKTTDFITLNNHGLVNNDPIQFNDYGMGTMPTPLAPRTTYYVKNKTTNTFQISATSGGAVIDITGDAGVGTIYAWGVIPVPLDSRLEYFVINKTTDTFQVSATKGGSFIDLTGISSTPCKVAKVYAALVFQTNSHDMYSGRISNNLINGVLGDGGARHGVIVERGSGISGTAVHFHFEHNEIANINKRAFNNRSGEMHGVLNHIYNVISGEGGALGIYANNSYAINFLGTRFEFPAVDRLIYFGSGTYGCVAEGTLAATSYSVTDLGTGNTIVHSNSTDLINKLSGPYAINLYTDLINEFTPTAGTTMGCFTAKSTGTTTTQPAVFTSTVRTPALMRPDNAGVMLGIANGAIELVGVEYTVTSNGNDNISRFHGTAAAKVTTTNNTLTKVCSTLDLLTISGTSLDNNSTSMIEFCIQGYRTGGSADGYVGDSAVFVRRVVANNIAGTITILHIQAIGVDFKSDSTWGDPDIILDGSTGVMMRTSGLNNANIVWGGYTTVTKIRNS